MYLNDMGSTQIWSKDLGNKIMRNQFGQESNLHSIAQRKP